MSGANRKMKIKIIALFILLALFAGTYLAGRSAGYDECVAENAAKKDAADAEDAASVKEIIKWRTKVEKVNVEKIKKIYITKDPTGCLDTPYSELGLGL